MLAELLKTKRRRSVPHLGQFDFNRTPIVTFLPFVRQLSVQGVRVRPCSVEKIMGNFLYFIREFRREWVKSHEEGKFPCDMRKCANVEWTWVVYVHYEQIISHVWFCTRSLQISFLWSKAWFYAGKNMCFFIQETEAEEEVLPCDKESSVLIYSTPDRKQKVFIYKKKKYVDEI